jgi:iron complex outermembrane receptor protein
MNKKWQDLSMLGAIIVAVGMPVQIASAQSGAETEDELIEEVVSVGTRSKPRSAADSPVPIDSFNAAQLDQQPHGDMTENIKNLVPSFTATPLTGDGSVHLYDPHPFEACRRTKYCYSSTTSGATAQR